MPVAGSMPTCWSNGWLLEAFGVLGATNTPRFREPLCCTRQHRSVRLFLRRIARDEPLPDAEAGISVGMAAHAARGTQHQWSTRRIALCHFALRLAHYLFPAAGTGSAALPGTE